MATFITRVELYGKASWEHYEKLHAEMERLGFTRTINGADGTVYDLPSAMYYRKANATKSTVLNDARAAANSIWTDNGVIVSETTGNIWMGLKKN
jgi:hypothetical protein